LMCCVGSWPVHLVCFARSEREVEQAEALRSRCASVYVELLNKPVALSRAALRFGAGSSLTLAFYFSARMKQHVRDLIAREKMFGSLVYSSAMAQYAPEDLPMVVDLVDVDSEKWLQFGETRRLGSLYRWEGRRLRREEIRQQQRATRTLVTTEQEARLLGSFTGNGAAEWMENGVDEAFFDPAVVSAAPMPAGQRPLVFVGAMDYYPNADAVRWFAENVFPEWRRRTPPASFWIVGRNPGAEVRQLAKTEGIHVTGQVADVRPYLVAAEVVIAPLRIARGIQNKVLEALAMGKLVLVSPEVAQCFGGDLPIGLTVCKTPQDYLDAASTGGRAVASDTGIREAACRRFSWEANLRTLHAAVESMKP
jgi:sugar transferase (PEP-CTERM/EpsH1 system associated)